MPNQSFCQSVALRPMIYIKSEVAEVLLYNRSLTDNEILKLEEIFAQ